MIQPNAAAAAARAEIEKPWRDALRDLALAAIDVESNLRSADGACVDCGQVEKWEHDDPDCALAGLRGPVERARVLLGDEQQLFVELMRVEGYEEVSVDEKRARRS